MSETEDKYFCINYEDFPHICRVCLKRGSEFLPIFNAYINDDISVHWLLNEYTKLEISVNDRLPSNICTVCLNKLFKIHTFIKQSSLNDSTLRLILESAPEIKYNVELCDNAVKLEQESPNNFDEGDIKTESEIGESIVIDNLDYHDSYQDNYDRIQINEKEEVEEIEKEQIEDRSTIEQSNSQNDSSEDMNEKEEVFLGEVDEGNISSTENSVDESTKNIEDQNSEVSRSKLATMKPRNDDYTHNGFQESVFQIKKRKEPTCEICHCTIRNIREHMHKHTREKPFICQCGQSFVTKANLRRHMRSHTGEKPHVCEQCGKAYTRTEYLRRHQKGHDNHKTKAKLAIRPPNRTSVRNPTKPPLNLSCTYCGCKFRRLVLLKKHLRKHQLVGETEDSNIKPESEERPYLCDMCGKSFTTKPQLDAHRIIHGEKSFYCSSCEKSFHSKFNLNVHFRTHSEEKPYACSVCKKTFRHKIRLDTHVLIHTGEKPYFCNICDKRFRQSSHLMYHRRMHSGERPYCCSFCGKAFAHRGNLKAHIRTHTGQRPYLCEVCGKGFHDSSSRNKHQKTHQTVIVL